MRHLRGRAAHREVKPERESGGEAGRDTETETVGSKAVEGHRHLKPLTLVMELQSLVFVLLDFSLAMVQCLPTMFLFLTFGMVICILWHSLYVEVCNFLFDLTGGYIYEMASVSEDTLDF